LNIGDLEHKPAFNKRAQLNVTAGIGLFI